MEDRNPKQLLDYRPIGRRKSGWPLRDYWTDGVMRAKQVIYWP